MVLHEHLFYDIFVKDNNAEKKKQISLNFHLSVA